VTVISSCRTTRYYDVFGRPLDLRLNGYALTDTECGISLDPREGISTA
jgi:hypothetical protein